MREIQATTKAADKVRPCRHIQQADELIYAIVLVASVPDTVRQEQAAMK